MKHSVLIPAFMFMSVSVMVAQPSVQDVQNKINRGDYAGAIQMAGEIKDKQARRDLLLSIARQAPPSALYNLSGALEKASRSLSPARTRGGGNEVMDVATDRIRARLAEVMPAAEEARKMLEEVEKQQEEIGIKPRSLYRE